jgi:DNA-directed RNA polymerase specialized sigma24 family protein
MLERLPEDQQEVLLLVRVYGKSAEEVARAVGTTAQAVHKKVLRAVKRLEVLLGKPPRSRSRIRRFFTSKEQP